jgi:hypothetical protein
MDIMCRERLSAVCVGFILTLALGAARCGGQKQEAAAPPSNPSPSQPAAPVSSPTPPATTTAQPTPPSTAAIVPGPLSPPTTAASAIAVQESDVGGVDVALLEVKRASGDTVNVRWEYRNKTGTQKQLLQNYNPQELGEESYLIDAVNRKKFLVVRDAESHAVSARHPGTRDVGPNETWTTWAKFPAPPESVTKISVYVPHAAPFEDVAISK